MMADKNRTSLLFVTKDAELTETVTKDLEGNNHRVVVASNDSEARLKVVGEVFDFVIVDMDMDGFDPASFIQNIRHKEELKKVTNLLPIIMFGEDGEHFDLIYNEFEKVTFLTKPLEYAELKTKLAILGGSSAVKENTRKLNKGIVLIEEGSASNEMYWVLKGSFVTTIKSSEGEKVIGEIHEGELIGEMSFLDNKARSATVTSLEECEILVIPHKKFVHAMDGQPQWFQALMRTLSIRLRNSNDIISGNEDTLTNLNVLKKKIEDDKKAS
jgi:CRP/FNR family transcriptional regulator, cyclic AMP receptor protein